MLKTLRVRGLALLSDVTIELGPGLNVLTGETGAGKSLLVAALATLLGRPGKPGAGSSGSELEIEAELVSRAQAASQRQKLLLRAHGSRLRATVDGQAVTVAELRSHLAEALVLVAQGAPRELSSPAGVLSVLDRDADTAGVLLQYRASRAACLRLRAEGQRLRQEISEKFSRAQRVAAVIEELQLLSPKPSEHRELGERIELLARRQQYLELCARIEQALSGREQPIESELSQLAHAIRRAPAQPALRDLALELEQAWSAVSSASRAAARFAEELMADPSALLALEKRRDAIEHLAARVGCAPDELAESTADLSQEQARLEELEARVSQLDQELEVSSARAARLAEKLHRRRERALPSLAERLRRELRGLALDGAVLELELKRRTELLPADGPSLLGISFSANPGQPALALERIASGGERSRFVLALACVGAVADRTLVFDEVDQGVGGEALVRLAERIAGLARERQIICVTHQATIAARADAHFKVEKAVQSGKTSTIVTLLDEEARMQELSRMLAGGRALDGARALARRLLDEARSAA